MKGTTKTLVYGSIMFVVFILATMFFTPLMGFQTGSLQKLITDSIITLSLFITTVALGRSTKG